MNDIVDVTGAVIIVPPYEERFEYLEVLENTIRWSYMSVKFSNCLESGSHTALLLPPAASLVLSP